MSSVLLELRLVRFLFFAHGREEASFFSDRLWLLEVVRKRDISTRSEALNIRAMFIFNSEHGPDASSAYFGEGNAERKQRRGLKLSRDDYVEDPVEAKDRVDNHSCIVPPCVFEGHVFAEELFGGIEVQ